MDEAAKKRAEQQERLERLRHMQLSRQDKIDSPKNIIQRAIQREYPQINKVQLDKATRELVLAPRKSTIKIGDDEIKVADLSYKIAESLELISSETTSSQEYFSWFTESSEIMQHMNDGFVSDEDLKERNEWLEMSYSREAEILTCLGLYQGSSFPQAKKKYAEIYNKLVKLRQIRNAIKETTANKADKPQEVDTAQKQKDYKKAVIYVAAMREFVKRPPRWNMPKRTLQKLNMYHGNDEDLEDDYDDFYELYEDDDLRRNDEQDALYRTEEEIMDIMFRFDDALKEDILFHWDDEQIQAYERSVAEQFIESAEASRAGLETEDDVRDHIARLSGRRPPLKSRPLSYTMDRARAFNSAYYNSLAARRQNA